MRKIVEAINNDHPVLAAGATVLHARCPPRDVRMSRVLSIHEARIKPSNPFLLEPYRKRLKRCAGCMSEFLHSLPSSSYPNESGTPTSTPAVNVCPGARCSTTTAHRASFVVIRTLTLLKLSSISNSRTIVLVCVCVYIYCTHVEKKRRLCI